MNPPDFIPDEQFKPDQDTPDFVPDEQFKPDNSAGSDFVPDSEFKSDEDSKAEKYNTGEQQVKAGLEGLSQGIAGPVAPWVETHLMGVNPEDIGRGRSSSSARIYFMLSNCLNARAKFRFKNA